MSVRAQRTPTSVGRGALHAPDLRPYLPRLAIEWAEERPDQAWQVIDGSLVFVDISGFTALSERLARRGPAGGEELTEVVSTCFTELLAVAYARGGSLLKFGGDALLLLFDGEGHALRAAATAIRMREAMARVGRITTSAGAVRLRMSVGMHSGKIHAFRVGGSHRELIVTGPAASTTVAMESAAAAGEILVSPAAAELLPATLLGGVKAGGRLLRRKRVIEGDAEQPPLETSAAAAADGLPVALRAHLSASAGEPEHRHATVAFIHFDGTDELITRDGPEAAAAALNVLLTDVQRAADANDVTFLATDIDRDGGKIILVGGAPTAHDDDAGRLMLALREVVERERPLPVRIGVNRGHVFAGEVGPRYRRTYTVMGDAVNLAARLMAKAAPGQILATEDIIDLSHVSFDVTALPPFTVKGKTAPVSAYAVGSVTGTRSQWGIGEALPFTGRESELGVLLGALNDAEAGKGKIVELVGDSGMGKSRLVEELRARCGDTRVLQVACEPYEARTPYFALRPLLVELLGLAGATATDRDLRRAVASLGDDLVPWAPLLGDVVGISPPATPETVDLTPEFRRERTVWVADEVLRRLLDGPTIVVFDDSQWMDDSSAAVLATVARNVSSRPWVVCSLRSPGRTGFHAGDGSTRLELTPLDDDASARLVAAATQERPLPPHRRVALIARAGGNPLFLAALVEQAADADDSLPDTLEAVIAAQIDKLGRDDRRLLRHAAVLGMVFEPAVLSQLVEPDLVPAAGAVRKRLRAFLEPAGRGHVRFRNQCARDVAYATLPFRRRQELHAHAARMIEGSEAASDGRAAVLALHFMHAEDHARCWHYAGIAARAAEAKYANVEVADLCQHALAAARGLDLDTNALIEMWELLADASTRCGMYDRARSALGAARRLAAGQVTGLARLSAKEADLAVRREERAGAARWLMRGLRLVEGIDTADAAVIRAELRVKRAEHFQHQGQPRQALRWAEQARAEAEAAGHRPAVARAFEVLDWVHITLGRPELATHGLEALAIWEEVGALPNQAVLLNNLGGIVYYQGRWDDALAYYERARQMNTRIGNLVDAAVSTCNIAEILVDQGRLDEAEPVLHEASDVFRSVGYPAAVAFATRHLGRIAVKRGDLDLADRLFADANDTFRAYGLGAKVIEVDAWRAESMLRRGTVEDALVLINDVLHREKSTGDTTFSAMLHRLRAYAYAGLDRLVDAWADIDESIHVARCRGAAYDVALGLEALAVLSELGGLPVDPMSADRSALLADLGVCALPPPPLAELGLAG